MDWTVRCKISPVGLVLGLALRGPFTPEEAHELAVILWPGNGQGPQCYHHQQVYHAIEYLKTTGVLHESGGGLSLRRDRLHPHTHLIAQRASEVLSRLATL